MIATANLSGKTGQLHIVEGCFEDVVVQNEQCETEDAC